MLKINTKITIIARCYYNHKKLMKGKTDELVTCSFNTNCTIGNLYKCISFKCLFICNILKEKQKFLTQHSLSIWKSIYTVFPLYKRQAYKTNSALNRR